jgi:hypothetical protein
MVGILTWRHLQFGPQAQPLWTFVPSDPRVPLMLAKHPSTITCGARQRARSPDADTTRHEFGSVSLLRCTHLVGVYAVGREAWCDLGRAKQYRGGEKV